MESSGRTALRVAMPFAVAAAVWALFISSLPNELYAVRYHYDYLLDLVFAAITGALLYNVLSRSLRERAIAEQAGIHAAWRAANGALEARVSERTMALEQANALLQAEIAEHARAEQDLTLVLDLSCQMASTHDAQRLQELILEHLHKLVGYSAASSVKYEGDRPRLLDYRGPLAAELMLDISVATFECPADQAVAEQRRPVTIGDLHAMGDHDAVLAATFPGIAPSTRSWMGVPMVIEDRVIGILRLEHEQPNYFTAHHARLAMAIANQAAVAIENAQLAEGSRRVAVLNERARLARDLHDSIIQSVYGVMWNVRSAQALLSTDVSRAGKLLERAVATAGTCLVDLRSLVFELRPELIEQHGLAGLLARHAESIQGGQLIDLSTDISGEPELPLQTKEALYRIAQEALHNAVKHSRARQVSLRLQHDLCRVLLEIEDDGVGFDLSAARPGHLGLISMQERAAQVGGNLAIKSALGRGTHIQVHVPMAQVPAAA